MTGREFVEKLLKQYPEQSRPQDLSYLRTIEANVNAMGLSVGVAQAAIRRIADCEFKFPVWAIIRQWIDTVKAEERNTGTKGECTRDYQRWKIEACSLDEALPYMVEQLVDSGEMSMGMLAAITGKWELLGIARPSMQPGHVRQVGGFAHAGSMLLLSAGAPGQAPETAAAPAEAPEGDPSRSSISRVNISSGGTPANLPFSNEGLQDVLCEGPGENVRSDYDDSDSWEEL